MPSEDDSPEEAASAIYRGHKDGIVNMLIKMDIPQPDAEQIALDTALIVRRKWLSIREGFSVRYAYTVARNLGIAWWKRNDKDGARQRRLETEVSRYGYDTYDGELMAVLNKLVLQEAMATLSPRQRQVVELRHMQDQSVEDTARALGISEGAVKRYTAEAMAKLRTKLTVADDCASEETS